MMGFCLHYEYQTKMLDMLITIFIVAHFIVLSPNLGHHPLLCHSR
jgi:hypothetical protein